MCHCVSSTSLGYEAALARCGLLRQKKKSLFYVYLKVLKHLRHLRSLLTVILSVLALSYKHTIRIVTTLKHNNSTAAKLDT